MNKCGSLAEIGGHGEPVDGGVLINTSKCSGTRSLVTQQDHPCVTVRPSNQANRSGSFLWRNRNLLSLTSIVLVVPNFAARIQTRENVATSRVYSNKDRTSADSPNLVIICIVNVDSDYVRAVLASYS
jgi:hypothetical protein